MPIHNAQYPVTQFGNAQQALMTLGPLLNGSVSIPSKIADAMNKSNIPIPNPINGFALLDTGASATCVDEEILKALRLPPVGRVAVSTPSGQEQQLQYPVRLEFPGTPIPPLEFNAVIGSKLKNQNLAILIGRDILCHCIFIVNGPAGHFSLSF